MDILAFVKPKQEVIFVYEDETIKEALDKMEKYRFASIPVLNRNGNFVGTLTEGDLLWHIKNNSDYRASKAEKTLISSVNRFRDYVAINYHSNMDELISKASDENFVPVIDDQNQFMGIITRKTLLNYFFEHNFIVL
jgi:CBS domain-containing protein